MPTISLTVPDDATVIATLKNLFPNKTGTVPTNLQLGDNVKAYLIKCLQQKYRGYLYDIAAMEAVKSIEDLRVT